MKKGLYKYLAMASMLEAVSQFKYEEPKHENFPEFKPISNFKSKFTGYKNYQFTEEGNFDTKSVLNNEIVFTCIAKSDRDAVRKYYEFLNQQNEKTKSTSV